MDKKTLRKWFKRNSRAISSTLLILSFLFLISAILLMVSDLKLFSYLTASMLIFCLISGIVIKIKLDPSFFSFLKNRYFYLHLSLSTIFTFLLFLVLPISYIHFYTDHGTEFELKDYQKLTIKQVTKQIEEDGLNFAINDSVFTYSVPKGTVFTQFPIAGTFVKKSRKIYLTINCSTSQKFKVPDVFNQSEREAVNQLSPHFNIEFVKTKSYNPVTSVVTKLKVGDSEVFPGHQLIEGTTIIIYFGSGTGVNKIITPNLIGLSKQDAQQILQQSNLRIGKIIAEGEINDTLSAIVFNQRPLFDTKLQAGDMVDIFIKQFVDSLELIDLIQYLE